MTAPLVFLDTETTALHPARKAWEVAMIRRDAVGTRTCSFFIGNLDLGNADPASLSIGRFYQRHPQYARTRLTDGQSVEIQHGTLGEPARWIGDAQAAKRVEEWTRGAHIVAAVPSFDTETLERLLRRHGHLPAWHHRLIDVQTLAYGYLAGRRSSSIAGHLAARGIAGSDLASALEVFRAKARTPQAGMLLGADAHRVLAVLGEIADDAPAPPALPWSSDELSRACGVEPPPPADRHTALGDARWVMRWYDTITGHQSGPVDAAAAA